MCTSGKQHLAFAYAEGDNRVVQIAVPSTGRIIKVFRPKDLMRVFDMRFDAEGTLWVVTATKVVYWRPGQDEALQTKLEFAGSGDMQEIRTASFSTDCKTVALVDQASMVWLHYLDRHARPGKIDTSILETAIRAVVVSSNSNMALLLTERGYMVVIVNGVVETDLAIEIGNRSKVETFGFFPRADEICYFDKTQLVQLEKGYTGFCLPIGGTPSEIVEEDAPMPPVSEAKITPMEIVSSAKPVQRKTDMIGKPGPFGFDCRWRVGREPVYNLAGEMLQTIKKDQPIFDENKNPIVGQKKANQRIFDVNGKEIFTRKRGDPIFSAPGTTVRYQLLDPERPPRKKKDAGEVVPEEVDDEKMPSSGEKKSQPRNPVAKKKPLTLADKVDEDGVELRVKMRDELIYNKDGQVLQTIKKDQVVYDENKNPIVGKRAANQKIFDETGREIFERRRGQPIYSGGYPRFRLLPPERKKKSSD